MRRTRTLGLLATWLVLALATVACSSDRSDGAAGRDADPADGFTSKATVVGDSIAFAVGAELRGAVDPAVEVKVIAEGGTGLARPDGFDWPARLEALAADFPPDVLVLSVGSNDHQDLTDAEGRVVAAFADEDGWDREYSRRLAEAVDHFDDTGTTVVWVGQAHSRDPLVGATNRRVHRLATAVAEERDFVVVTDMGDSLGSGEAPATACLEPDGVHLTLECTRRAAVALGSEIDAITS